ACASVPVTVNSPPQGPTLLAKAPNLASVCFGTGVNATFTAGSGGVGCTDDYIVIQDGGTATAYTPGSTVGATAISTIVIQGRRAGCPCLPDALPTSAGASVPVTVNSPPQGPTLLAKAPNLASVCFGTGVNATFTAGSGGV